MQSSEVSGINLPPGPADTIYPTPVLARVMFAKAAADLSDQIAKLVDIDNHEGVYARCNAIVQEANRLRELAVVYDFERQHPVDGVHPENVLEHPAYGPLVWEWRQNIERPFAKTFNGWAKPTVPKGVLEPKETAQELDRWAEKRGVTQYNNAISVSVEEHTAATEKQSIMRHAEFLANIPDARPNEHQAQQLRMQRVSGNSAAAQFLPYDEVPESEDPHGVAKPLWPRIIRNMTDRAPALSGILKDVECLRDGGRLIVIGHPTKEGANILSALAEKFLIAYSEVTGLSGREFRAVDTEVRRLIQEGAEPPS